MRAPASRAACGDRGTGISGRHHKTNKERQRETGVSVRPKIAPSHMLQHSQYNDTLERVTLELIAVATTRHIADSAASQLLSWTHRHNNFTYRPELESRLPAFSSLGTIQSLGLILPPSAETPCSHQ